MAVKRPTFPVLSRAEREARNPFTHREAPDLPEGPFRIGELSRLSGVAVGTIKYYLREGLVPPGRVTARTQALYGPEHLRRLRVVRVLVEVGGLSIAEIGAVVAAIDGQDPTRVSDLERAVAYPLDGAGGSPARVGDDGADVMRRARAREATDGFVDGLGLVVGDDSPARAELADALLALDSLGYGNDPIVFLEHARLAFELGELEVSMTAPLSDPAEAAEGITVGSVVFGAAFMALRRMAHEHETRRHQADAR